MWLVYLFILLYLLICVILFSTYLLLLIILEIVIILGFHTSFAVIITCIKNKKYEREKKLFESGQYHIKEIKKGRMNINEVGFSKDRPKLNKFLLKNKEEFTRNDVETICKENLTEELKIVIDKGADKVEPQTNFSNEIKEILICY